MWYFQQRKKCFSPLTISSWHTIQTKRVSFLVSENYCAIGKNFAVDLVIKEKRTSEKRGRLNIVQVRSMWMNVLSHSDFKKKSYFKQFNSSIALSKNEKQVLVFNIQLGAGVRHSISREVWPGQYELCPCDFMKIKKKRCVLGL